MYNELINQFARVKIVRVPMSQILARLYRRYNLASTRVRTVVVHAGRDVCFYLFLARTFVACAFPHTLPRRKQLGVSATACKATRPVAVFGAAAT